MFNALENVKCKWDNIWNVTKVVDNSTAMIAATPVTINLNYVLAECPSKFYGEGYRWYDLLLTQKWNELSSSFHFCGFADGDHTPISVVRDIKPYRYLRQIPQVQFDTIIMHTEEKAAYHNYGY